MPIDTIASALDDDKDGKAKLAALSAATAGLKTLQDAAHLHSLVTVDDCTTFLDQLHSIQSLHELGMGSMPGDTRPLAFLLMEQVQFANLLVLNKTDLLTSDQILKVEQLLRLLNPLAKVVRTTRSAIDVAA